MGSKFLWNVTMNKQLEFDFDIQIEKEDFDLIESGNYYMMLRIGGVMVYIDILTEVWQILKMANIVLWYMRMTL